MSFPSKLTFSFLIFSTLLSCIALLFLEKQNTSIDLTVVMIIGPRDNSEFGPRSAELYTTSGKRLILQRAEFYSNLKGSERVWQNLLEGQEVTLYHHFRGWKFLKYKITLNHHDKLVLKSGLKGN